MNPFNSNSRQAIALITGTSPGQSKPEPQELLSPRTSAIIIFKLIKLIKPHLRYFPNFEELSKDIFVYHPNNVLSPWQETDWQENHPARIQKVKEIGFPSDINETTRVIGLFRMWGEDKMIVLTKKGKLLLLGWVDRSNKEEPSVILSATLKVFSFWDLVRLIKDSRTKEPHFPRIWRENIIKDSLASLVEEHLNAKREMFEAASGLNYEVIGVLSRFP
jgi:hypothetical protein